MDGTKLFETIEARDPEAAQAILQTAPELAQAKMPNGVSLLLMAIYFGQFEIARLIRAKRETVDIWEATALGELEEVTNLIASDPTLINAVANDGFAPLGLATFFGQAEVMSWLLANGADADQPSQNEMRVRPVHSAAAHRNPEVALTMMEQLIKYNAQLNVAQHGGWTPLHQAADHGHAEMVTLLLKHGADKEARSENNLTPNDMAQAKNHVSVVKLLAEKRN